MFVICNVDHALCFLSCCGSFVDDSEAAACVRELLMQLTDSTSLDNGSGANCPILLRPYALNGAARGYRLVEPAAT